MQFVQTFLDYIASILVDLKHYQLILISLVIASLLPTLFFFVAKHKSVAARLRAVSFHVEPALISSIALMFGLFSAFLANDIWGANQAAKFAVVQEAEGVRNILRYSAALTPNEAKSLRAVLAAYVHNVLDNDWPAMQEARLNPTSSEKLNDVAKAIFPVLSANDSRQAISQKLLEAFQQINSGWQTRTRIAVLRQTTVKWQGVILFALLTQIAIGIVHIRRPYGMVVAQVIFGLAFALTTVILFINEFPFSALAPVSSEPIRDVLHALQGADPQILKSP